MKIGVGLKLLGEIVRDGMRLWSEERARAFKNEYADILHELEDARNRVYPEYTDAALALAEEKYRIFFEAFLDEQAKEVKAQEATNA